MKGYEVGNRYRVMSVLRLELIMMYLSVIIYLHLFSYFHPILKHGKKMRNPMELAKLKRRCQILFTIIMIGAHLTYFYYFFSFEVPYLIYWPSALSLGIWMHLLFFSLFFMFGNVVISVLNVSFLFDFFMKKLINHFSYSNLVENL